MLPGSTTVGETICYEGAMKVPTAFSHWVKTWVFPPILLRITGNEGTSSSRREVRSILVSRQHCYFCLRRNAGESDDLRYGCVCTEQSLFEMPSLPDAMEVDEDRP